MELELKKTPSFYSITQYNRSVERLLKTQVPRIWVKGVITQLNVRGRMAYLTLGEFAEGDARPKAVLELTLWASELEAHNLKFSRLPTPLLLRVELKVAVQVEANFYVPSGRFQPRITAIDENFTLGELSLTRQKTLERLAQEGLLKKNKALVLSPWPLRIGLITAPGSAAYQDFTTVLLKSGFSFQIFFAGAKMQGDATESSVLEGLKILSQKNLDVICLVRGGGAKTDLVYFDSEKICRGIALCPMPVLTGIGHEIDNSLADLVAYADKITPTDCAKFLESRLLEFYATLSQRAANLSDHWKLELQEAWHILAQRAEVVKNQWQGRRSMEELRSQERLRLLSQQTRQILQSENRKLALNFTGLMRGPEKILQLESLRFKNRLQGLAHNWSRLYSFQNQYLKSSSLRLKEGANGRLSAATSVLQPWSRMVKTWWKQGSRNTKESLALKTKLIKAADPARMLMLGFSIMRNSSGSIVTRAENVKAGDLLIHQMQDGQLESKVEKITLSDKNITK